MTKVSRTFTSKNFATIVGVLIVIGVFSLAIGLALFWQNQQNGVAQWPFNYFKR